MAQGASGVQLLTHAVLQHRAALVLLPVVRLAVLQILVMAKTLPAIMQVDHVKILAMLVRALLDQGVQRACLRMIVRPDVVWNVLGMPPLTPAVFCRVRADFQAVLLAIVRLVIAGRRINTVTLIHLVGGPV